MLNRTVVNFLVSTLTLFCCLAAQAETELEPTIVHGTNSDIAAKQLDHVTINRSEFKAKYLTLSEVLQQQTGVQVRESGLGNPTAISIRGSSHQQVTMIVDGFIVENSQYGGFDLNHIPLNQIESIDIYQGAAHGLAPQAVGGTIHIKTRNFDNPRPHIQGTTASNETYQAAATGFLTTNKQKWLITGDALTSKNNYEHIVEQPDDNALDRNRKEKLHSNAYHRKNVLAKGLIELGESTELQISAKYQTSKKDLPNYLRNNTTGAFIKRNNFQLNNYLSHKLNKHIEYKLQGTYKKHNDHYQDLKNQIGLSADNNKYDYSTTAIKNSFSYSSLRIDANISHDFQIDNFEERSLLISDQSQCVNISSICDKRSERNQNTLNGFLSLYSENQKHQLSTTYHYQKISSEQKAKHKDDKTNSNETHSTYAIAYGYSNTISNQPYSLSILFDRSNRIPTLQELYGDFGLLKSSPNLKPEKGQNTSLSFNIELGAHIQYASSLFYRQLDNAIVPVYDSRGVGSYQNTTSAKILGFQQDLTWSYQDILIKLQSQKLDSITESNTKSFNEKYIAGVFHNSTFASIRYSFTKSSYLSYQYQNDDNLYIDRPNLIKHKGRELSNIFAGFEGNNLVVIFKLINIFDKKYQDFSNRPAQGLNYQISLNYQF